MAYEYNWPLAFEDARKDNRKLLDEHIYEVYQSFLLPFAKSKTNSEDAALEICSNVLTKFWEKFYVKQDSIPQDPNRYLNTMLRNAIYYYYNLKNKEEKIISSINSSRFKIILSDEENIEDKEDKEMLLVSLEKAFEQLDEKCKKLIKMNVFKNIKIKDIKSAMGFPTANAATQKKVLCLKNLRKLTYFEIQHQNKGTYEK